VKLLRLKPERGFSEKECPAKVRRFVFSPDGHLLVSGAAGGALRFWGLSEAIPLETGTS
jgi:WD40 repeat protein